MRIVPVTDGRDLDRFIAFPYDHYRGDPLWVPQLRADVRTLLSPTKNPFFKHAEARYFVGRADGRSGGLRPYGTRRTIACTGTAWASTDSSRA